MSLFRKKPSAQLPRRRQAAPSTLDRRTEAAQRQRVDDVSSATFRRNRTLSGSASSHVKGAGVSGSDLKSPRVHAHELTAHRRRLGGTLLMVLVVAGGCFTLLYQLTARVQIGANDHTVRLEESLYQKSIDGYLHKYPIERLRFALDDSRLTKYVQAEHPEVYSVRTEGLSGVGVTRFSVDVRKSVASWQIRERLYFVDADGVSYEKNYYESPAVRIVDESGAQHADGTAIASRRFLTFVGQVISMASDRQMIVSQATIPHGTTRQVEVQIEGAEYRVKLSLDRPVGEQIEDMQRAVAYLSIKKVTPKYIDVRVSGRAFYRD